MPAPKPALSSLSPLPSPLSPSQVERYKALLLKQRDIMIALTARLTQRDEQILGLQAEIEAYDAHQRWAGRACAAFASACCCVLPQC